jgi:PAS domain S-box-containing protein
VVVSQKKNILLVEDEFLIAMNEKSQLEKYGYRVSIVNSGEKTIEAIRTTTETDLILMDINLGNGIDGTEAAAIILKDHDIPIVFVSSHSEREIVEKTEKITSYGYVVKNSSITVLDASIKMAFKLFDAKITEQKKEALLHENEEKYRLLHETAGIGIGYYSPEGKVLSYNRIAAQHMNGVPEDFIGKSIHDLFPKADADTYQDRLMRAAETDHPVSYEDIVQLPIGTRYFLSIFTRITGPRGNLLGIQIISQDITENKIAERSQKEIAERFRTLAELAPVGIYLTTPGGGLSPEEAMGQGWIRGLHPDDAASVVSQWNQMVASKGKWGLEYRFRDRQGNVTNVYGLATAQYDEAGNVVHYVGTNTDITERKHTEAALRESENKYKLLHENAAIGIGVYSPEGIVVSYNKLAAKYMGGVPEDFIGKSVYDLYPKADAEIYCERIRKALAADSPAVYEDMVSLPSERRYFLSTLTRISDINDQLIGIQIIAQDITERKKTEELNEILSSRINLAMEAGNIAW